MSFFDKNKNKIIVASIVALSLFAAYFWGAPDKVEEEKKQLEPKVQTSVQTPEAEEKAPVTEKEAEVKEEKVVEVFSEGENAAAQKGEAPTPADKEVASSLKIDAVPKDEKAALECTISISCATAVGKELTASVPADGMILAETTVGFTEGESVFDVLCRVTRENKIHMEFVNTPIYNSAYIEGIGNLYEYDLGPLSGWMYRVNGVFPDYGCSGFTLSAGDRIEWVYTCDLGKDVGGDYSANSGEKNG